MSLMALIIFSATFIWLATEKTPRHLVALSGAGVLMVLRLVTLTEAFHFINWRMLIILLAMFVVVGFLFEWNVFNVLGSWLIKLTQGHPIILFFLLPLLAGVLSMFLNNIAVMLFLSLLTLELCHASHLDPVVLITSEVCAANAGGGATLIGSPPNLIMGTAMKYSFHKFLIHMGPLAALALALILGVIFLVHLHSLVGPRLVPPQAPRWIKLPDRLLFNVWKRIDWQTLMFFVGLFILVGSLEKGGVFRFIAEVLTSWPMTSIQLSLLLLATGALVSAFVDNIPMALSMAYLIKNLQSMPGAPPEALLVWSCLIGLTLGGNMTPIGASPNVVAYAVLERAGQRVGWFRWALLTIPPTLVALAGVSAMIWFKYNAGWY